jgi:hypothetical protein
LKRSSFFDFNKETKIPAEQEMASLRNLYESEELPSPFIFDEQIITTSLPPEERKDKISELNQAYEEMKKVTKELEPGKYPNYAEMPIKEKKLENVPDNLPIADETFFAEYEDPKQIVEEKPTSVVDDELIIETKKEPTPEELKKRLNQLLRGEL